MNSQNVSFDEHKVLHYLTHFLPAQNPLKDFVHHNTLHAFQNKNFHIALQEASTIFGYKTYLSLEEFRKRYINAEINENVLDRVIIEAKGDEGLSVWKNKLLNQKYDESTNPRIGSLRSNWKKEYAINLEKSTHSILFRVLCSYLDQGIAMWNFPDDNKGFLSSIITIEQESIMGIFTSKRAKKLLFNKASITQLLEIIVGKEELFEQYLFDQQFSHPGWSGMIATIESNPLLEWTSFLCSVKCSASFAIFVESNAI